MRLIALQVCAGIAALLFITALVAIAAHRARHRCDGTDHATALAEYVSAVVPWIMVVAAALPAVRLIVAER